MKIYIDFDGVILDTDKKVSEIVSNSEISPKEYIRTCNWNTLLRESEIINNSLGYLKTTKLDINLLSKISTLDEGIAKVKFLRENDVTMNIHLVPNEIFKNDIVEAKGNILIDDKVYNLDKWTENGGIAYFFNRNNEDVDVYGKTNEKYNKICDLSILENTNI